MKPWMYWSGAVVLAFLAGRYLTPEKVKTVEVVKTVEKKDEKTVGKVVRVKKPDGTVTTTKDYTTETKTASVVDTNRSTVIVTQKSEGPRLNLMAGGDLGADYMGMKMNYGLMLSKQLVGPFSLGVFGTTAKTVGVTVGVQF